MAIRTASATALLAVNAWFGASACSPTVPLAPGTPLFERLGGMQNLPAAADDFVSKVSSDPRSRRTFEAVNLVRPVKNCR